MHTLVQSDPTKAEVLQRLTELARTRQQMIMWAIVSVLGHQESYLDIQCGDAWRVRTMRIMGTRPTLGVTSSTKAKQEAKLYARVVLHNFSEPFIPTAPFKFVTAFDVTENQIATLRACANTALWIVTANRKHTDMSEALANTGAKLDTHLTEKLREYLQYVIPKHPQLFVLEWVMDSIQVFCTREHSHTFNTLPSN